MCFFYRWENGFEFYQLETGKQEAFGLTFTVYPIKTMTALCYKLDFLESPCNGQCLTISSTNLRGEDKLDGISWYVAANNTWQGIIQGHWPYENIPLKFYGELKQKQKYDYNEIRLKEHKWNYLNGYPSFEKCCNEVTKYDDSDGQNCNSIFDPNSSNYKKGYIFKPN